MINSWDSYYVVVLSAILSLGIPGVLALISVLFFSKNRKKPPEYLNQSSQSSPLATRGPVMRVKANQTLIGQRMNVRFFLAANAALILITLALELIPCVITIHDANRDELLNGLVSIVSIAGFAVLGLLYCVRKGDMGWLSSFHSNTNEANPAKSGEE